ncbi:reverse transcriptase domain-containing protein [Tanacetum coccineum]
MAITMTTRNVGRRTATTRGGRISEQNGQGGERTRDQTGRGGGQIVEQGSQGSDRGGQRSGRGSQGGGRRGQRGGQGSQGGDRGNRANGGSGEVPDFATIIAQQLQNLLPTIVAQVYNRGREAAMDMTWEEFKVLMREELCPNNKMQKLEAEFWCHAMVGASHATYTDRFHELARLVPHLVTPENKRIERNGALKRNTDKRGNSREPSRDGNVRDDTKRSRTGRAFAIITNPVRKEYTGHFAKDCRAGPRMVIPLNVRNSTTARGACFECGGTDHYKAACPRLNRAQRP